jgi:hypothetical protein
MQQLTQISHYLIFPARIEMPLFGRRHKKDTFGKETDGAVIIPTTSSRNTLTHSLT